MGGDEPMMPDAAPGGRPRRAAKREIGEAILYLLGKSVFEKVDSHGTGIVIHGVSESTTRDECRCPTASAAPIRAT
jgi:hypothetical protein